MTKTSHSGSNFNSNIESNSANFLMWQWVNEERGSLSNWYVSIVSIIFDCSMPIFYNFHIHLATFYTIFGTNILIQCLVPVPVCCMFFVSQKIHSKRSPNGIKTDGDFLESIWFLGRKIHARRCPRGPRGRGHAPDPRGHPVRRLVPFFRRKKYNIRIEIMSKIQPNRSYGSLGI